MKGQKQRWVFSGKVEHYCPGFLLTCTRSPRGPSTQILQPKGVTNTQIPVCVLARAFIYISSNVLLLWAMTGASQLHLSILFHSHMVADKSRKGSVIQEMACWSATGPRKISGHRIRRSCPPAAIFTQLKAPWAASIYAMDYPQQPVCLCTPWSLPQASKG